MSRFIYENHRGSPSLTLLNVLGVLGVLKVLNVLNVLNVLHVLHGRIVGLLGLALSQELAKANYGAASAEILQVGKLADSPTPR